MLDTSVEHQTHTSTRTRAFPGSLDLSTAAALFARERTPEAVHTFSRVTGRDRLMALEHGHATPDHLETVLLEGPQWRVEIAAGVVAVASHDPARAERAAERALADARGRADLIAQILAEGDDEPEPAPARSIRAWSSKSRSKMIRRLAELDYAAAGFDAGNIGMVTLTYPGDWHAVAPSAQVCAEHVRRLRKRWERAWGPVAAVWKREFQRRGAPHYHLGCVIPAGEVNGERFPQWLSRVWTEIVGADATCLGWAGCLGGSECSCSERARHRRAGTGVDFEKGGRAVDPRRFAFYFAKHGTYAAKEYQNEAPPEWDDQTGVGRFWGYWRLEPHVASVLVAPDVARTVVRTARRWSDAGAGMVRVHRWRKVSRTLVDQTTGEISTTWKWRRRSTLIPVRRLRRSAGYLVVNDGPRLASELARAADALSAFRPVKASGAGPRGYLP